MRVLFLVSCVTDHDEKFVRNLSAAGYETRIFSFHSRSVDERLAALPHISVNAVPLRVLPRAQRLLPVHLLPRLRASIREFRPDVMHSGNTWNESFLAALSGFHPLLVMPYGSDVLLDTQRHPWFAYANRKVFRAADWVTVDAEHVKRKVITDFAYPAERMTVIPWGIDVEAIAQGKPKSRDRVRAELGWQDNVVLIMTRNHEPVYGIDGFIRAMEKVIPQNPRIRVLMIGGGALTETLQAQAETAGVAGAFRWTGKIPREKLLDYLYAADLYVSSSHSDGTSVSLLEAMASGLSAVLTDVPSNLEWITSGHNGEVVPRGDPDALAKAILGLASSPDRNVMYGRRNLEIVRARGDWAKNFRDIETIYATLSNQKRHSP
jgi:glycosyltransferase involved in cell wall biosynthesis